MLVRSLFPPCEIEFLISFNDETVFFITLTDVSIDGKEQADFVALNKNMIESVTQLE